MAEFENSWVDMAGGGGTRDNKVSNVRVSMEIFRCTS
jgi:hypothetical protein